MVARVHVFITTDYIIALKLDPTNETIVAEIKKLETDVVS